MTMTEGSSKSSSFHHQGLSDDLLIDILCRLPCESVLLWKCVSKHWHALISDSRFFICLVEHKIRTNPQKTTTTITAAKKWTLLQTKETDSIKGVTCRSLDLSLISDFTGLDFLPFRGVTIAAAFKDLILCYNINQLTNQREYHIANPVTKQWSSLPPSPLLPFERDRSWDALICEEPYHYDKDHGSIIGLNLGYRFRVVLVHPFPEKEEGVEYDPLSNFNLVVFCSEMWQWKQVILFMPTYEDLDEFNRCYHRKAGFDGVVCNRILYLRHNLTFGTLDPFKVRGSSNSAIVATSSLALPPYSWGSLYEVKGNVLFLNNPCPGGRMLTHVLKSKKKGCPVRWQVISNDDLPCPARERANPFRVFGYDIMNKRLAYMILTVGKQEVILYDMRSRGGAKSLRLCVSGHDISAFTFEPQYWPTPIPDKR